MIHLWQSTKVDDIFKIYFFRSVGDTSRLIPADLLFLPHCPRALSCPISHLPCPHWHTKEAPSPAPQPISGAIVPADKQESDSIVSSWRCCSQSRLPVATKAAGAPGYAPGARNHASSTDISGELIQSIFWYIDIQRKIQIFSDFRYQTYPGQWAPFLWQLYQSMPDLLPLLLHQAVTWQRKGHNPQKRAFPCYIFIIIILKIRRVFYHFHTANSTHQNYLFPSKVF